MIYTVDQIDIMNRTEKAAWRTDHVGQIQHYLLQHDQNSIFGRQLGANIF